MEELDSWFLWMMIFWVFVLGGLFAIGGYFIEAARKLSSRIPLVVRILDWEEYYVDKSLHLCGDQAKSLLNELVTPVPDLFRPIAKQKIAGKVGQIALEENATSIEQDHIIRGYIQATPKRDHKFLRKNL